MTLDSQNKLSLIPEKYRTNEKEYIDFSTIFTEEKNHDGRFMLEKEGRKYEIKFQPKADYKKLISDLIYNIRELNKIDVDTIIERFIGLILNDNPNFLTNSENFEVIKELIRENIIFTIYKEYQKLFLTLQDIKTKLESGETNYDLEYFVLILTNFKHKLKSRDFDTGFDDLNKFLQENLIEILNFQKIIEAFAGIHSFNKEQYQYNHKNPNQIQDSILPYFNIQKSLAMGSIKSIYFKSNFLTFSSNLNQIPFINSGVNFLPLNREEAGLNPKFVLTLLITGFENLIYAYDQGMFEEFTSTLRNLKARTNYTQALIFFRLGFKIFYDAKEFTEKEEFVSYFNEKPFQSEIFIEGDIEVVKDRFKSEDFQNLSQKLKSTFNSKLLNESIE